MHDGDTTYCWHIPQPTTNTKLNESDRVDGFSGVNGCPMTLKVELTSLTVVPFEDVNVTWTVSADFTGANKVNMTKVTYGDDANGDPAQIVHSNIHTCVFGTGCDPFSDGEQLIDKTVNQIANLTDNLATFTATIQFPETGQYSVLAHIIMPDSNESERFDYGVYIELDVETATATPTPTPTPTETPTPTTVAPTTSASEESSGGGVSNAAIIGIIVGGIVLIVALIVIAFIFRRRRSSSDNQPPTNYAYMAPPPYEAVSSVDYSKGDNDRFLSEQTTAQSQGTWGGPGAGSISGPAGSAYAGHASAGSPRSSQNLDGTGGSGGSRGSYEPRQPPVYHQQQQFRPSGASTGSGPRSTASQRPRRVESDVEL